MAGGARSAESGIVRPLFPDDVLVGEIDPRRAGLHDLRPAEAAQVERAVAKRQREYAAGRRLARDLMRHLDVPSDFDLLNGEDRAPLWPHGVVGTISHTGSWAAVAVARSGDVLALGCDLELDKPLSEGVLRRVCGTREREWIAASPPEQRQRLAMLVFSAKEAVYKAQYPLTGQVLNFSDFVLHLEGNDGFRAQLQRDVGGWRRGGVVRGRWAVGDGLLATAVALRAGDSEHGLRATAESA